MSHEITSLQRGLVVELREGQTKQRSPTGPQRSSICRVNSKGTRGNNGVTAMTGSQAQHTFRRRKTIAEELTEEGINEADRDQRIAPATDDFDP
jgi:hypothetical protein